MPQTISPWDILTSSGKYPEREQSDECTTQVRTNAADLAERVSKLLDDLGRTAVVTSGFRTIQANKYAKGAVQSAHCEGKAIDLEDNDGGLGRSILNHVGLLASCDLYMEHPLYTNGWVHLQSRATKSGRRVFVP